MTKCNKISFHSKAAANDYIFHINHGKSRKRTIKAMMSYKCMDCTKWHLTSQSKAQLRRRKRYNNKCDKRHQLIIDFKCLSNNTERWKWLVDNQGDWMVLHIDDDRTYVVFSDKCRVLFD